METPLEETVSLNCGQVRGSTKGKLHFYEKHKLVKGILPQGYKSFFMLNSIENEILNSHKYKNTKKNVFFLAQISLECYFSRS